MSLEPSDFMRRAAWTFATAGLLCGLDGMHRACASEFEITADSFTVDKQVNLSSAAYFQGQASAPGAPAAATQLMSPGGLYFDGTYYKVWNSQTGAWVQIATGTIVTTIGVPVGAVMFFNLSSCPAGWSALAAAQGRYLVGLPSGGALAGTDGTALSNLEDRPVGMHTHTITDPGHSHTITDPGHSHTITDPGHTHSYTNWSNPSSQPYGSPTAGIAGYSTVGTTGLSYTGISVNAATTGISVKAAATGISVNASGTVAGTNAPYLQLLVCQKN